MTVRKETVATCLYDAMRLHIGRCHNAGREVPAGFLDLFEAIAGTGAVLRGHLLDDVPAAFHDAPVARLLTIAEAADVLQVSTKTVQRLASRSDGIRTVKIGRATRIRPADLQAFIDSLPTTKGPAT